MSALSRILGALRIAETPGQYVQLREPKRGASRDRRLCGKSRRRARQGANR